MPTSVALAVGASMFGEAVAWAAVDALVLDIVGFSVVSALASTAFYAVVGSTFKKGQSKTAARELQDRKQMIRSPIANRLDVYGRAKISGPIVYARSTGENHKYLHLVVALAAHECDAVEEIWFGTDKITLDTAGWVTSAPYVKAATMEASETFTLNDGAIVQITLEHEPSEVHGVSSSGGGGGEVWTIPHTYTRDGAVLSVDLTAYPASWVYDGLTIQFTRQITVSYRYTQPGGSKARVLVSLGAPGTPALAELVAECGAGDNPWTNAHRLEGITYLYARLEYDTDVYTSGVPNLSVVLRGKKVTDPRTGHTAWSDNPALFARDYLLDPNGLRCEAADLDDATFVAAANLCDEEVTFTPVGGGDAVTQKRYFGGGVVDRSKTPAALIEAMLSACAGALIYSQGVYRLYGGAYSTPTDTLTESDLRDAVRLRAKPTGRDVFNGIKGVFVNPARDWQASDFPPVKSDAYRNEDGGVELLADVQYEFTTDVYLAQRLALIQLQRARQGISVELRCNLRAIKIQTWDVVRLSIAALGWTAKPFRVLAWKLAEDAMGVDLTLQEEAAAAWTAGTVSWVDSEPDTALPDPRASPAPGAVILGSGTYWSNGLLRNAVEAAWPAPADTLPSEYELAWTSSAALPAWASLFTTQPRHRIEDAVAGSYLAKVRSRNALGVWSDWAYSSVLDVVEPEQPVAPPVQVTNPVNPDPTLPENPGDPLVEQPPTVVVVPIDTIADAAVTIDALGNALIVFYRIDDPQIIHYELRVGDSFEAGTALSTSTGNTFTLPILASAGNTYWIAGAYADGGYTAVKYRVDFSGAALTAPTNLSWAIAEPNLLFTWAAILGASQYLVLLEVGGVTTVKITTTPEAAFPIPKWDGLIRVIAMAGNGAMSAPVDEEIAIAGQYRLNEIVNIAVPITTGRYVNLAFTAANTVKRASLRGLTPIAPYALNINDGDLYGFGYNLAAVGAANFAATPADWFRHGFWREREGFFESSILDLGAVLTGKLALHLTKSIDQVGDAPVSAYGQVLAEYMADTTAAQLIDHLAFLTARFLVASDSPQSAIWQEVANGDWITARYVKIVIEVAMASPLTEITVTAGAITLDVPDITESGSATGVTSAGLAVTFTKPFTAVSVVIATARGAAKAYTGNITATGCTLYVDSGTQQVDYFVKGY